MTNQITKIKNLTNYLKYKPYPKLVGGLKTSAGY
jgi:hypothetical protein